MTTVEWNFALLKIYLYEGVIAIIVLYHFTFIYTTNKQVCTKIVNVSFLYCKKYYKIIEKLQKSTKTQADN